MAYKDPEKYREYHREYNKERRKQRATPEGKARAMLSNARGNAGQSGVVYGLDEHQDELIGIIRAGRCHDSGVPFSLAGTGATVGGRAWNQPSLDRRDTGGGYTWDNVRVVLWAVNQMRCDMSIPMFHALCHLLSENLTKRYGPPDLSVLIPDQQNTTKE